MHKICCFSCSSLFCSHDGGIVVQDTHDEFGHIILVVEMLASVLYTCDTICFVSSWFSPVFILVLPVSHYKHVYLLYLNTTWYIHPGLADCRQACIYGSILDHWLLSDCSLFVHKCINCKDSCSTLLYFSPKFFLPWPYLYLFLDQVLGKGRGYVW